MITATVLLLFYGAELGGLASTMPSHVDRFLAPWHRPVGNAALAGSVRTELLHGYRARASDPETCNGCRSCAEI